MSLNVALQSVVFYVLSCSTCAKISHRRKAKAQAKRERAEKHALETEQPGLYRHPSPFSTNPFWTEEIMMGPGPPRQKNDKGNSKNTSQRAINTAGSSIAGSTAVSTEPSSSPTAVTEGSRLSGEGWNLKRYQREDEALWGIDLQGSGQKIKEAIAKAGSSAGRLLENTLGKNGPEKENQGPYYLQAKNPPVNDLHPPVVSTQPSSRDETRWMLQPPPSAKIMEGKVKVNRSRASSNSSSQKNSLSRQVTERLMEERLYQLGESPSRPEMRVKRTRSSRARVKRQQSTRSHSTDSSDDSIDVVRRRKPPPLYISTSGNSSGSVIEHIPVPSMVPPPSTGSTMEERPSRPVLSTIVSSSVVVPKLEDSTSSMAALRELSPRSTNIAFNTRESSPSKRTSLIVNSLPASIPSKEVRPKSNHGPAFPKDPCVENSN